MANKDKDKTPATGTALATSADKDGTLVPQGSAGIVVGTPEQQMAALYDSLGITDPGQVEVIAGGKLPFWPAIAGAVLAGTITGRRDIPTRFKTRENPQGLVGVYTIQLKRPAVGAMMTVADSKGTMALEYMDLPAGQAVTVIERAMLKELSSRLNQDIAILCVGQVPGRNGFSYWDYRIIGIKRTAEQISAGAMAAMAEMQKRQLTPGSVSQ